MAWMGGVVVTWLDQNPDTFAKVVDLLQTLAIVYILIRLHWWR